MVLPPVLPSVYTLQSRSMRAALVVLAIAQLFDVVTTNAALAHPGTSELNPLIATLQQHLGHYWAIPKLVMGTAFATLAFRLPPAYITTRTCAMTLILAKIYLAVIISNAML